VAAGTLTSAGIGSGLEIEKLITDLVDVERKIPAQKLDKKENETLAKITALGTVRSELESFNNVLTKLRDTSSFQPRVATVRNSGSSTDVFYTATANSNAAPTNYQIEVVQLAQANKLATTDFSSQNAIVGSGVINLTVGSRTFDIPIAEDKNTLALIRDEINKISSESQVTASILTLDSGNRLVLTANNPGLNSALSVAVTGDSDGNDTDAQGLSALASANLTELQPARNSIVRIDNQLVTTSSNTLVNVIEGVTLELQKEDPGNNHQLDISLDTEAAKQLVNQFIDSYNSLVTNIRELTKVSPVSLRESGVLVGDVTIRSIENNLRSSLQTTISNQGGFTNLFDIGISTDPMTGLLKLDSEKLDARFTENFDAIGDLFGGSEGVAVKISNTLDVFLKNDGTLDSQTSSLETKLIDIGNEREKLDNRLKNLEELHRAKFIHMDQVVARLSSINDELVRQLDTFVEPLSFKK